MIIYKITNRLNGKIYIGQTRQKVEQRFLQHAHAATPLGNAMRQCGLENFTVEIIENCDTYDQANDREKFWIKALNSKIPNGYNKADGGRNSAHAARAVCKSNSVNVGMTIGEALRRFRREFNLTQDDVAAILKTTRQAYSAYETDKGYPPAQKIIELAQVFNVSTDYLLGLSDEPRPVPANQRLVGAIVNCRDAIQQVLAEADNLIDRKE